MDFLTVSVKMAQTFEAATIRGKRGTFITIFYGHNYILIVISKHFHPCLVFASKAGAPYRTTRKPNRRVKAQYG
jgi:hypothetical protein